MTNSTSSGLWTDVSWKVRMTRYSSTYLFGATSARKVIYKNSSNPSMRKDNEKRWNIWQMKFFPTLRMVWLLVDIQSEFFLFNWKIDRICSFFTFSTSSYTWNQPATGDTSAVDVGTPELPGQLFAFVRYNIVKDFA